MRFKGAITSSFVSLNYTTTSIGALISFAVMIATGTHLQAFQIFTLLMGFNVMKFAVCVSLTDSLRFLVDVQVALKRVQTFLEHDMVYPSAEDNELPVTPNVASRTNRHMKRNTAGNREASGHTLRRRRLHSNETNPHKNTRITITNISCTWTDNIGQKALDNVTLHVANNQLVVITGSVGSGKSSLLLSIIEELPLCHGKIRSLGRIAYISQTPWVFSGTVRENIVFGRPFNQHLYNQALEACDLQRDLRMLPGGDMTKVGQHGASLSGGQRARVSLARALYSEARIYLLDDPLSAVDSKVGKLLFERCICGMLSDCLRILVTHQVQYLKVAHHVVVLDRGSVVHQGSPKELPSGKSMSKISTSGKEKGRKSSSDIAKKESREESSRKMSSMADIIETEHELGAEGLQEAEEDRNTGSVSLQLYWSYLKAGLHPLWLGVLMFFFCFVQGKKNILRLRSNAIVNHRTFKETSDWKSYTL